MEIVFEKLRKDAVLPSYAHGSSQDAGMDLYSVDTVTILAGETAIVNTGLRMSMPPGIHAEIRSRSGMAVKGMVVANSPGTIDPSYRGEIGVILRNNGIVGKTVYAGERVAQMVIMPYIQAQVVESAVQLDTDRGEGGYGSTGS